MLTPTSPMLPQVREETRRRAAEATKAATQRNAEARKAKMVELEAQRKLAVVRSTKPLSLSSPVPHPPNPKAEAQRKLAVVRSRLCPKGA